MTVPKLAVLVPTRGRPGNVRKVISAWDFTAAWDCADLVLIADADDPEIQGYRDLLAEFENGAPENQTALQLVEMPIWMPMVHKLDEVAREYASGRKGTYFALAFAGDDHLPQTIGWARRYLTALREIGSGMVYGDDGYQGRKLSTEWAVTADAVRALGRMVPAPVEHLYCDNSMMDVFGGARAMKHLPEIRIEHMHPYAGKAETDAQYQRVNHRDQSRKDRTAYESWHKSMAWAQDVATIRELRKGLPEVTIEPTPDHRPKVAGSAPRRVHPRQVQRSGPSAARGPRVIRTPRHFRLVRAATPEDVMIALADFAVRVPADQEIVELGVFHGRTALQLAWGASQGQNAHVTAIDPWDLPGNVYDPPFTDAESRTWARHWVDSLGYQDRITLVQGFSHEVAESWSEDSPRAGGHAVGLLYVDGDHTKEGAKRDIEAWAPHLAPGATIAVDDYGHPDWPGVGQAVDELVAEGFLEPIQLFHDRLAVTRLANLEGPRRKLEQTTTITSEGVSPPPEQPKKRPGLAWDTAGDDDPEEPDSEVSTQPVVRVADGELEGVATNTPIEDLNLAQLKALAKGRGIVLGIRKDKRSLILQALRDGR